jgi:hypothetical protein
VPGLPAGQAIKVRSPHWTAVGRHHAARASVDALGAVTESDEANNTETEKFEVRGRHKHHRVHARGPARSDPREGSRAP